MARGNFGSFGARLARLAPVLVLVLAMTGVGLVSPSFSATARTVSILATPKAGVAGTSTHVYGRLSSSPTGSAVKVQRKSGSGWVTIRTVKTTTADGRYSTTFSFPTTVGNSSYRAVASSTGNLKSAISSTLTLTTLRKVSASINATPTRIARGATSKLFGQVSPFVSGRTISIERLSSTGSWVKDGTAVLGSTGRWSKVIRPTATASWRVFVPRVGLNGGAYSGGVRVTVVQPPVVTTTSLPTAAQAFPYSQQLTRKGGSDTGSWAITAGFLPFGLQMSKSGLISGTPTATGTSNFTVRFTDAAGRADSQALSITVIASVPPEITTTSLPGATRGTSYSGQLVKAGKPGAWSVLSGSLPIGISLNATTGELTGTPTGYGSSAFTVRYKETGSGLTDSQQLTLTVGANPPSITTTTLTDGHYGVGYAVQLNRTGLDGTWSRTAGELPDGMSLSTSGLLSGTPTDSGDFGFTVRFTENAIPGLSDTQLLELHVTAPEAPVILTTVLPDGKVSAPYSTTLVKSGRAGSWSVVDGILPSGLSLGANTGLISGTPTAEQDRTFTVRFTENATSLSDEQELSIHVATGPVITSATMPEGTVGLAYSKQLTKLAGAGTWAITGGALPNGLSLNSSSGLISGTTTTAGDFVFTVSFTETSSSAVATKELTIHVEPAPVIITAALDDGTENTPYAEQLAKSGRAGSWSVTTGSLPAGLNLNSSTGAITGTPTTPGTSAFTVTFTETSSGATATKPLSIQVNELPPVITTASLPDGTETVDYSSTLTKTGRSGSWSVSAGTLPTGLSLNSSTGVLSGTPTAPGDFDFTIRFTVTGSGLFDAEPFSVHIEQAPAITTTDLPDGLENTSYSATLTKTGRAGTWQLISGNLPNGLSLNPTTGAIAGTATTPGDFGFTVRFIETVSGAQVSKALIIHIAEAPPVITTTSLPDGTATVAYSATLTKTGRVGTWSVTAGTLPTGLTLNPSTGVISGTATAAGDFAFTVRFTVTSSGLFDSETLSVHIEQAPTITTTVLADGLENTAYSATLTKTGRAGTWSVTAGALPNGLGLAGGTGAITGTATVPGTFNFTVRFTETVSGAQVSKALAITIAEAPPVITTTTLPNGTEQSPYTATLTKTGRAGTWSVSVGSLPSGLSLNPSTGAITGTPATQGDTAFTVTYTVTASGLSDSQPLSIHVNPIPPTVTSGPALPDATAGDSYSTQLLRSGEAGTWARTGGDALPAGLTLSSAGVLSGTPTVAPHDSFFTVTFTETATGLSGSRLVSIHTAPSGGPAITTQTLPNGKVGVSYSHTMQQSGGVGNSWSFVGSKPAWLNISAGSGNLSGTPTAAGDFVVTIRYQALLIPLGQLDQRRYILHINP